MTKDERQGPDRDSASRAEYRKKKKKEQQSYDVDLANRLIELGYSGLFQQSEPSTLESIWNATGAPKKLEILVANPKAPVLARFLAAEILFYKDGTFKAENRRETLAPVYAAALSQNLTESANPWGLPGILDGLVGEHLLALGKIIVPELVNLLDNNKRIYYAGSKEATLGNHYGYRVKDLAAYYISLIKAIPFQIDEEPNKRDEEIDAIKHKLEQPEKK